MSKYYYQKGADGTVYRYTINRDTEYDFNPRDDYGNVCRMNMWWNNYGMGDENKSFGEVMVELCDKYLPDYDYGDVSWHEMMLELQTKVNDRLRIYPIYVYEHSGITISMADGFPYNDRWDGGIGGLMIAEKETFDEYEVDWGHVYDVAKGEVDMYDMYLQGEVYEYWMETYIGDGEWEENGNETGYFSRKYGDELAEEILGKCITEDEVTAAMLQYDLREQQKAEYGMWLMAQ